MDVEAARARRRLAHGVLGMLPSPRATAALQWDLIELMFEECEALPFPGKPQWYPVFGENDEDDA